MLSATAIRRALWIAALVPFLALALLRLPASPRFNDEDYAHYLLHAQALATGRAYTNIGFIRTNLSRFTGPSARPPGTPLLLAPAVAVGGVHSTLIPLIGIAMGLAFLVFAARSIAAREAVPIALAVALLSGLQPGVLHFTSQAMSDIPFATMVWLVIAITAPAERWSAARVLAITAAGAAAIACRLTGIALIPAIAAFTLLRYREQRLRPLVPLVAWCGVYWLLTHWLPTADAPSFAGGHSVRSPLDYLLGMFSLYGDAVLDAQLYPFGYTGLNRAYHLVTLALLAIGTLTSVRDYWRSFLGLFTASYAALLLVASARDLRYFYPLIPVIIVLTLRGAVRVMREVRPRWTDARLTNSTAIAATVVGALAIAANWSPATRTGVADRPEAQSLFAALRALPQRPPVRVMSFKPRIVTLETGAAAMPLLLGAPEIVVRELCTREITDVVLGDLGLFPRETMALRQTLRTFPGAFRETYRNAEFIVWHFDRGAAALSVEAACARDVGRPRGS